MATEYNRQYVGARYVPKFFNNPDGSWDWAQGFQYEPLTMVKYGENTYTSKMLVPATTGSPNLNPEYWANTGNYNGAILDLKNDIKNVQLDIQKTSSLKNRNFLFLGDSYGSLTEDVTGWGAKISALFNVLGINHKVIARGGYGWVGYNGTWGQLLLEAGDLSQFTDIIILGGANDINANANTVNLAMQSFMGSLYSMPLKVSYGFIGHYTDSQAIANYNQMVTQRELCYENSINYIGNAFSWIYSRDMIQADKLHPTNKGVTSIVRGLLSYLYGGSFAHEGKTNNLLWQIDDRGGKKLTGVYTKSNPGNLSNGTNVIIFNSIDEAPPIFFPQMSQPITIHLSSSSQWFIGYLYLNPTSISVDCFGINGVIESPNNLNLLFNDYFLPGII